jgi:hypothetical protein
MPEYIIRILEIVFDVVKYTFILSFLIVGIWVTVHHIKERLTDYVEWFRDKDRFRVRTTIVKHMMGEERTQIAKLRRIRVSRRHEELILDPWPRMLLDDGKAYDADLDHFYSVPGILGEKQVPGEPKKFILSLKQDEVLRPHKEDSTFLAYILNEKIDGFLTPPYFTAIPPVGEESFTYEVHFPSPRRYVRDSDKKNEQKPKIKVYHGDLDGDLDARPELELPYEPFGFAELEGNKLRRLWLKAANLFQTRYHVVGGSGNFGDKRGVHDWFRVTILKPPQNRKIHICWSMQGDLKTWPWS